MITFALQNNTAMTRKSLFEVSLEMLPGSSRKLTYGDLFMMDDSLDGMLEGHQIAYDGTPVKLMFVIVMFCVGGTMQTRINLQELTVGEGDLLVVPPGAVIDRVEWSGDCRAGYVYIANYHHDLLPSTDVRVRLMTEIKNQPMVVHFRPEAMERFVACYRMIRQTIDDDLTYKDEVMGGLMQTMCSYWLSEMDNDRRHRVSQKLSRDEQIYRQFIDLVRRHYAESREVTFYADRLNITAKYLGVVVTRVSGRRPLDWIRDHVILDAKAMILSGRYTMQQISDALSFANPSFFGRYFRDAVGCSPGNYGQMIKGEK